MGAIAVWFVLGAIGLILAALLLVKQFIADDPIPLLVLHVNSVVCERAFSVYMGMTIKETKITKDIANNFVNPIFVLFLQ
jgi:hypothetical protein